MMRWMPLVVDWYIFNGSAPAAWYVALHAVSDGPLRPAAKHGVMIRPSLPEWKPCVCISGRIDTRPSQPCSRLAPPATAPLGSDPEKYDPPPPPPHAAATPTCQTASARHPTAQPGKASGRGNNSSAQDEWTPPPAQHTAGQQPPGAHTPSATAHFRPSSRLRRRPAARHPSDKQANKETAQQAENSRFRTTWGSTRRTRQPRDSTPKQPTANGTENTRKGSEQRKQKERTTKTKTTALTW